MTRRKNNPLRALVVESRFISLANKIRYVSSFGNHTILNCDIKSQIFILYYTIIKNFYIIHIFTSEAQLWIAAILSVGKTFHSLYKLY